MQLLMRDSIVFFLNGELQELRGRDVVMNLARWLRERMGNVGTKVVCNEGDCGACSVLVGHRDGSQFSYRAIDSCIAFPFQLDQTHIVTVEGLKRDDQLSAVQQAMVDCHGSQCGFCTPGFVTTIHGMLEKGSSLCESDLRYGLSGNLCRCTGYIQIIDAGKSIDTAQVVEMNQQYPANPMLDAFDAMDDSEVQITITKNQKILIPKTVDQVVAGLHRFPNATIVSGATDFGVVHNHGLCKAKNIISLASVDDFENISVEDGILRIDGGATWTKIEHFVETRLPQYHEIITRFGSPQIRNMGTLAGNLAGGSPIGDSIPFHMVMDADLELTSIHGTRSVKLSDFYTGYRENVMGDDELITSVVTPMPKSNERLALFKISKRRDMDISTETMGVWVQLHEDIVADARIAVGGVGPVVMRIESAEKFLIGQPLNEESLLAAGKILRKKIAPWTDVRGSNEYRLLLAENLLLKSHAQLTQS